MKQFVAGTVCAISCAALSSVALSSLAFAQQVASATGMGTVTGHITCADTQRPARFADVTLFGVPAAVSAAPPKLDASDPAAMAAAIKAQMGAMKGTSMVQAQTDITGAFVSADVAPGDYYVFAVEAGYVNPLRQVQAMLAAGADAHKPLPGVTVVHVVADHSMNVDTTIARGAAVSGTVMWDDGTPVSGAHLDVVAADGGAKDPPPEFAMLAMAGLQESLTRVSDDLGRFRLAGLPEGKYVVQVTLPQNTGIAMQHGSFNMSHALMQKPMMIYAPAAFHKGDAKPVELKGTDEYRDLQITVNLNAMHKVSGRVASAEDHHGLNEATIQLTDTTDKDFVRSGFVDASGNFTVSLVPPGTYDLKVTGASDSEPNKAADGDKEPTFSFSQSHAVKSYEDGKLSVIVSDSDVAGQVIELTPSKKVKPEVNLGDLLKD